MRDLVKCIKCGSMRFEDEVILDKTIWDYVCRDATACANSDPKAREINRKKYRKRKGLSK